MKTIALTAAALLVAAGSAFAGDSFAASDHFQGPTGNQSTTSVDSTYTSSVRSGVSNAQSTSPYRPAKEHQEHWGNN